MARRARGDVHPAWPWVPLRIRGTLAPVSAGVRDRAALAGRLRETEQADRVAADVDRDLQGGVELVAVQQTGVVPRGPVAAGVLDGGRAATVAPAAVVVAVAVPVAV